jgi:cytosine/adenosine deaminase-related metal-dependent hydrolase
MHLGAGDHGSTARSVARLRDAGLLGADLQVVHANMIGDDEVDALVHSGAGVVVTPVSESLMGHGAPAYGRFRDAGGAPALGVDVVVNGPADLFAQLRTALAQERLRARPPVPGKDLLRSVTIDAARAIGLGGRIGSLSVGKRADVVLLDGVAAVPAERIASAVAATLGPSNVRTVLVVGEVVKRDGHLTRHDLAALREDGDRLARRIVDRSPDAPRGPLAF